MTNYRSVLAFLATLVTFGLCACQGAETSGSGGGAGGQGGGGTGGSTTTTTTVTTSTGGGGAGGTGAQGGGGAGGTECVYPSDNELGYFADAGEHSVFEPLPGEENGGSGSRLGPWPVDRTFTRVRVVSPYSDLTELPVDVWEYAEIDPRKQNHVSAYVTAPVEGMKPVGLSYFYTLLLPASITVPAGHSVFVSSPLASHYPMTFEQGECYDWTRAWWLGRTIRYACVDGTATCDVGQTCSTGLRGICSSGTISCNGSEASCDQDLKATEEKCGNKRDDDCDGQIDEGCDGACVPQPEACNGVDDDCDDVIDNGCPDADNDGYPSGFDCDDENPLVHPGAPEACGNGVDDNCNGVIDDSGQASWAPLKFPDDSSVLSYAYDFGYGVME